MGEFSIRFKEQEKKYTAAELARLFLKFYKPEGRYDYGVFLDGNEGTDQISSGDEKKLLLLEKKIREIIDTNPQQSILGFVDTLRLFYAQEVEPTELDPELFDIEFISEKYSEAKIATITRCAQ